MGKICNLVLKQLNRQGLCGKRKKNVISYLCGHLIDLGGSCRHADGRESQVHVASLISLDVRIGTACRTRKHNFLFFMKFFNQWACRTWEISDRATRARAVSVELFSKKKIGEGGVLT